MIPLESFVLKMTIPSLYMAPLIILFLHSDSMPSLCIGCTFLSLPALEKSLVSLLTAFLGAFVCCVIL